MPYNVRPAASCNHLQNTPSHAPAQARDVQQWGQLQPDQFSLAATHPAIYGAGQGH